MNEFLYIVGSLFVVTLIHEMGHYIAALLCGVRVAAVSIFFIPIFLFTIGNTVFSLGIIPMGGFTLVPELYKQSKFKRLIIYSGGIVFNMLTFALTLPYQHLLFVKAIGIFSIIIAVLNLLPAEPFDGKKIFQNKKR